MMDAVRDMVGTVRFLFFLSEPLMLHLPSSDGRLPLHLAAGRAASLEVVRYLAHEDPSGLRKRDGHGCLPLHLAAHGSAVGDEAPPSKTAKEIVVFLAEAHPQGLLEASDCGWLPLHFAVSRSTASPEAVRFLAEAAPSAPGTPSKTGQLPLHVAASAAPGRRTAPDPAPGIESLPREGPRIVVVDGSGGGASLDVVYLLAEMFPEALRIT
jgi:hypothetical protein